MWCSHAIVCGHFWCAHDTASRIWCFHFPMCLRMVCTRYYMRICVVHTILRAHTWCTHNAVCTYVAYTWCTHTIVYGHMWCTHDTTSGYVLYIHNNTMCTQVVYTQFYVHLHHVHTILCAHMLL